MIPVRCQRHVQQGNRQRERCGSDMARSTTQRQSILPSLPTHLLAVHVLASLPLPHQLGQLGKA